MRTRKTSEALEVHKQKVQCAFCSIRWALPSITKLPLIKIPQFSRLSELIPLISSLCSPNKFPNPNTQKIYNKFPNQLRKKKINPLQIRIPQNAKQKKKTSEYSKIIELQDEIEGECVNNTDSGTFDITFRQTTPTRIVNQISQASTRSILKQQVINHVTIIFNREVFTKAVNDKRVALNIVKNLFLLLKCSKNRNLC